MWTELGETMAKSIKIQTLKDKANQCLRDSDNKCREGRLMLQTFTSALLMGANAYRGFSYLTEEQVAPGKSFGIVFDESEARAHSYPDDSRIHYI